MSWIPNPLKVHENQKRYGDFNFLVKVDEGHPANQPPRFTVVVGLASRHSYDSGQVVIADRKTAAEARQKIREFLEEGRKLFTVLSEMEADFGSEE